MKIKEMLNIVVLMSCLTSTAFGFSEEDSSLSISDQRQADTIQIAQPEESSFEISDKRQAQSFTSDQSED